MGIKQSSGVVDVRADGSNMFYWLFDSESAPETDPLVIWLTGGPGCSSELAVFMENGPYRIDYWQDMKLNEYTWSKKANMLFVDNPIGTGFSTSANPSMTDKSEKQVVADFHAFLSKFLQENPQFEGRNFFVAGESYAGHYIPGIAQDLVKNGSDINANLKGIAIGNGWVDPYLQYPAQNDFALLHEMISESEYNNLKVKFSQCQSLIHGGQLKKALKFCENLNGVIFEVQPSEFD